MPSGQPRSGAGTMSTAIDLARAWVTAMNRHDVEAAASLLAPNAVFWANAGGHGEIARDERLAILQLEFEVLTSFEWYDVKALNFDGGCVLRMRVRGKTGTGAFDSAMCSFLFFDSGKINRI